MDKNDIITLIKETTNNLLDLVEKLEDYGTEVSDGDKKKIYETSEMINNYIDKL